MKLLTFALTLSLILLLSACKNDLNINAPYKEIPSIYAVLDPSEAEQMIRINKVFLGEGDANQMAKVADSINYAENELEVKLERYVSGKKVAASVDADDIIFTEKVIETQPGSFNTNQRVYVTSHKLYDNGEYRLIVKNKNTGNVFKAKANSLAPVSLATFKPLSDLPNYPYPGNTPVDYYIDYSQESPTPPFEIKYTTNAAYAYQLVIRFHIVDSLIGQASEITADYNAGVRTKNDVQKLYGGQISYVSHTFNGAGVFASLGNEMAKHTLEITGRRVKYLEYIVYNSAIEYSDYLDYIKPSFGINQNKPLYSNFENADALGLFTFRTKISATKQIRTEYMNAIAVHPSTCKYRFFNASLLVPGCK